MNQTDIDIQSRVRELAQRASELASRADSPTAHPNYQAEKITAAWHLLTRALLELGDDPSALATDLERICERHR